VRFSHDAVKFRFIYAAMNARCCSFVRDKHLNVIRLIYPKRKKSMLCFFLFCGIFFLHDLSEFDFLFDKKLVHKEMVQEMNKQKIIFHMQEYNYSSYKMNRIYSMEEININKSN
jgi:hypothetical protein